MTGPKLFARFDHVSLGDKVWSIRRAGTWRTLARVYEARTRDGSTFRVFAVKPRRELSVTHDPFAANCIAAVEYAKSKGTKA